MKIILIEPFFSGSHQKWAEALQANSQHSIEILSLPGKFWKWRMHGGAVELANQYLQKNVQPDLILVSDMLDLSVFLALTRHKTAHLPTAIYFHENQLTYPWSPTDADVVQQRDFHYSFINYTSALAANAVFFNSNYHKESFLNALPNFLNIFPDTNGLENIEKIRAKAEVLPLGLDLDFLIKQKPENQEKPNRAVLLWNHRWEYDKNPEHFFNILFEIKERGIDFKLIVLGEKNNKYPPIFDEAKNTLAENIIHWGYAENKVEYAKLLWLADILFVTSHQDFFGGSVVEAMSCNVFPLLPNRLAYPEHLPNAYKNTFLYTERENLTNKVQRLIIDVKPLRKQNIQQWVMQYDWKNCIEKYDASFQGLSKVT